MPLRSCTHASLVSMTRASAWLSIRRDGTAMPLPARSARACAMRSGSGKAAARHAARHRVDPLDVERRQVADLRSEEHTSELQSQSNLVCRLLLEKKKKKKNPKKRTVDY